LSDPDSVARDAEAFHARAQAGDFSGARRLLARLKVAVSPLARAWSCAVRAQVWLAFPDHAELPSEQEIESLVAAGPVARRVATHAAYDLALASVLDFDAQALARRTKLLARLANEHGASVELVLARAWCALLAGDPLPDELEDARKMASAAGMARAVVELQAIRAMAALESADDRTGLDHARRASLMARAEGIPQAEFVAHLTLARARRRARQVHLALRIVEALQSVVTRPWQRWLAWEAAFARGAESRTTGAEPSDLASLLEAARAGDLRQFHQRAQALADSVGAGLFGREARDLIAALTPDAEAGSPELTRWRRGDTVLIPPPLHGFMSRPDHDQGQSAAAYVLVRPGARGKRLLHPGLPLVDQDVVRVRQSRRAQGRVETLLAIVALAGPDGLTEPECFGKAYGFDYVAEMHRGVFDVLLHRARGAIESHAELERSHGRLILRPFTPLLLPDPQVSERMTDRVLRLLAQRGSASARQAASELGVSLRAVQNALNELGSHGACAALRDGRHVAYVVEDTVFSEPTLRLSVEQLR
jgi:hypothetical protein